MQKYLPALKQCIFLFVLLCWTLPAFTQDLAGHNWYFGNNSSGIRFNRTDNTASLVNNQATPFGTGGSAVASDPVSGNLLFYTDGERVYDATHTLMLNGSGLQGSPSENQPVAISKVPDEPSLYYIFHRDNTGTLFFTVVNMNLPGNAVFPAPPSGDVDAARKNQPVPGLTGRSDAMIVVPHNDGNQFWLITHEQGTTNYSVTLIGTGMSLISQAPVSLGLITNPVNLAYHATTGSIAVVPGEGNRNVEILDFDNTNGTLSFNRTVPNTGVAASNNPAFSDAEWSNSGRYLYLSVHGEEPGIQANVVQVDLSTPGATPLSVLPQPNTIFRSYGLQLAPDSAIYHLYQATNGGPYLAGKFTDIDTIASEVNYAPAFPSNPDFNAKQFPVFTPKDTIEFSVTFTAQGSCSNTPISFFPEVVPAADSLVWDFGDGGSATGWSPVYSYQNGGSFTVTVVAYLKGDTARYSQTLNITQFDLQLTLVQDTTACSCELPVNGPVCRTFEVTVQAQGGSPTYQWFGPGGLLPGQTTATLQPDSAGYYYVVATQGACSAYAGVNIKEYDSLDQRANIWYFGQNAGIDFNGLPNDPPLAITGPLDTPEGCAVICDRNGQVVFSTDGLRIYDKANQDITPATNPPGLGGDVNATQSALIMPVPGDETLYYIFTTQEIYGTNSFEVRYSLYDLKLNNGQGGLVTYNQLLFRPGTERLTGNGNWLIAHEYGNNSFRAYRISAQGIGNPVISSIGSDHSFAVQAHGEGYMKLGPQNRLAVALSTPGVSNVIEIFDFIDSTGVVTNFRTADLENTNGQVYGIEFSPGGNKLFATLKDTPNSRLYEFAFDTLANPYYKQDVELAGELGAMQLGPDGQIYIAINGSSTLSVFQAVEDTASVTDFANALQPFNLAGGTVSHLGLPNFTQIINDQFQQPGFAFSSTCLGDSTLFTATGKDPAIDKFYWSFGDNITMLDAGPQVYHVYDAPGTYTVSVTIYNRCETPVATFTQDITIYDVPPSPDTVLALCHGSIVLDANRQDVPNLTYEWSTGETTETITVNPVSPPNIHDFNVTLTNEHGCITTGLIRAIDGYRPQVNFGPDQTLCQNIALPPLDAGNPGANYVWEINGIPSGNTQTLPVDTSVPGIFEYKVQVTDPNTTCFVRDSITYTINASPQFTSGAADPSACGANDGEILIDITNPAGSLFTVAVAGPTPVNTQTDRTVSPPTITIPNLSSGTYTIVVTDQVTSCATTATQNVNDNAFAINSVTSITLCDPLTLQVDHTAVGNFDYRLINTSTGQTIKSEKNVTGSPFDITGVPSGSYVVEMTSSGCTTSSYPQLFNQDPEPTITGFTVNPCTDPITITVNGGTTYSWTGPGIITGENTPTISVTNLSQGNHTFSVTVGGGAGTCPLDTTITVNVNNNVAAEFTQSDPCADEVTLSAAPSGSYTYRWYRNGTLIPGGQQIIVPRVDNGVQYEVHVVNTQTGCVFQSPAVPVNVAGEVTVDLTTTLACEGSPFVLTATSNQTTGVSYTWTYNGAPITDQTSPTLQETQAGRYGVTATVSGCQATDEINIQLAPVTPGLLNDTGVICPDPANPDPNTREVVLDPGPGFTSYEWFMNSSPLGVTTQTYTATDVGTYRVELVNIFGCPSADETVLVEECDPRITGPNAFRPTSSVAVNGEFVNREFGLYTFFVDDEDFQIFIYNRWGEMVFYSNDRNFRWNGGYNNNPSQLLPPGTYTYVVKYKSSYRPEDGILEKRGGVVLVR